MSNCCDPYRDSRHAPMIKIQEHPHIKMLTLTLRVTQKHVFRPPKIKTLFICHKSFSPKFLYAKKEVWGYAKKERHIKLLK